MSRRMTAEAFLYLKSNFPEEVKEMARLEVEVERFNMFRYRRRSKNRKKKTAAQKYGEELAAILEWLDENCTDPYFPRISESDRLRRNTKVEFYFISETDAVAFKLMFQ